MRAPRVPALVAIAAMVGIGLYSGYRIETVLASNAPTNVVFTLGTSYRDLNYGDARALASLHSVTAGSLTLDLYVPSAAVRGPLPLAVFVHGGGMTAGDKTNINPVFLNALASAGYAVASINYRLAPQFKFPAQIEDVKCAIRYLRSHAQTYDLNAREIVAFGTSVGGQLVALAALTGPHSAFDVGPYLDEPSTVTAVADIFGPANLTESASGFSPTGIRDVFGSNSSKNELLAASPTHYVIGKSPPMLLIQGVNDTKVRESQAIELYNDLRSTGNQAQLILVQNMGHMFAQVGPKAIDPSLPQLAQDLVSFFDQYTRGA